MDNIFQLFTSPHTLIFARALSLIGKFYMLVYVLYKGNKFKKNTFLIIYLSCILVAELVVETAWITYILRRFYFQHLDPRFIGFFVRMAWMFELGKCQYLGLFIEKLADRKAKISLCQRLFLFLTFLFTLGFILISFLSFNSPHPNKYTMLLCQLATFYAIILIGWPTIRVIKEKLYKPGLPKILKKQLLILSKFLMFPYILCQVLELIFLDLPIHLYIATLLSAPLLTFAIFYSLRKVMGLRFLNFENHVQLGYNLNPVDNFKKALEMLGHSTSFKELNHITQQFFKDEFRLPLNRVSLRVRMNNSESKNEAPTVTDALVENFIASSSSKLASLGLFVKKQRIIIADEIAFSNFYEEDLVAQNVSLFMDQIDADIFLPIFDHDILVAYIVVERNARAYEFFTSTERDQMMLFGSYLANIINLLHNRDLERIIQQEKQLHEELYKKHQEINQYKESIRSFLRDAQQRKIGIIFYKNRRFIWGNQDAKELIGVDLNQQSGHPLSLELHKIVQKVENYKTTQSQFAKSPDGTRLVISALPHIEKNTIIFTVSYPEISDVIKQQLDLLNNPSEWDYLLYLETTQSGQLINQLIPGSGAVLLNFKIELLKMALSNKALLLEIPEDDLRATVEILHHISLRQTLQSLVLSEPDKGLETAIQIFGMNHMLEHEESGPAFLEKLNNIGTLFVKNIHFLSIEAQETLAEFIKYGHYRNVRCDKKIISNVRIICSTNQDLGRLVTEGKFSERLFFELKQTTLRMPSLFILPKEELAALAEGFSQQAVTSPLFRNLLELSSADRTKLIQIPPVSIQEFKQKIEQLLKQKSKKNNISEEIAFDPAYYVSDPELMEAVRLGKAALRDQRLMALLWNKFKSQNKIATFLGVNRSSVNRRCKEFNLD